MVKLSAFSVVLALFLSPVLASGKDKPAEEQVEVKCLVPENKIIEISEKLHLPSEPTLTRVVCFFDSASLDLFHHVPALILRSRYDSPGTKTETTVKVRGDNAKGDDVECEFDKVCGKEHTRSCSLNNKKQDKEEIKTANGGKNVKKIFSSEQEAFAKSVLGKVHWSELRPYGPVHGIQVWKEVKITDGHQVTVERWDLPARPGKQARVLFEVSAKGPLADEAKIAQWLADFLGPLESGPDQESETKTRKVLEHFAD
ncbi:MAG: hypothetical protein V7609_1252 [Verrucomicrobiota bacterium]